MKLILGILNAYDHRNRGDRAIVDAQIAWLKLKLPDAEIRVFSPSWEENTSVFGKCNSLPPPIRIKNQKGFLGRAIVPLLTSLKSAIAMPQDSAQFQEIDAFFLCGGGYLYSSRSPLISRQLWMHVGNSFLGINTGKPVMQFPQSWGPLQKPMDRWICQRLATRMSCVCSRGEASTQVIKSWGLGEKTIESPDIVLALSKLRPDLVKYQTNGNGELGISPIDFGFSIKRSNHDMDRYLEKIVEVSLLFVAYGGTGVVFFPQVQVEGKDDDLLVAAELSKRLDRSKVKHRIVDNVNWESYFDELSRVSVFLGSRMHACIFAMISGVPALGLSYQPKFDALFKQLDIPEFCFPINNFGSNEVGDKLILMLQQNEWRERIKEKTDNASHIVLERLDQVWVRSGCDLLFKKEKVGNK
jgi:polysaccharide pyruvyl transferase WcaK-like protein